MINHRWVEYRIETNKRIMLLVMFPLLDDGNRNGKLTAAPECYPCSIIRYHLRYRGIRTSRKGKWIHALHIRTEPKRTRATDTTPRQSKLDIIHDDLGIGSVNHFEHLEKGTKQQLMNRSDHFQKQVAKKNRTNEQQLELIRILLDDHLYRRVRKTSDEFNVRRNPSAISETAHATG